MNIDPNQTTQTQTNTQEDDSRKDTLQQQQQQPQQEEELDLDIDHDVDSTLERVREKRQKEREEKLASMMSQYHRKYSTPSEPNSPLGIGSSSNDNEEDKIGKRNNERSRRKEDLAEQMKKYRDQYENIISGVNNILSSPSTSSNTSSNVSPVLFSSTPTIDKQYELESKNNTNNNSSSSNSELNNNNNINNSVPLVSESIQQQQQPPIQPIHPLYPIDIERILFFERQDIPFLTDVGFKTLKGIEQDAMRCSESLISLTHGLNNSLLNMTKMSVELFGAFQMSNDSLSAAISTSIAETESIIDKCVELNQQTKPIHQLFQKIKSIKDTLDKFDTVVHNVVKQLDKDK
ncbi:hypothetical protein CYY_002247 [Polysphondylium violaceum]|uniref:BLOC-1-related complex subunit 6 C-terminal helix domain-containing protein n=1 Tax=Polysphondylium violaceum TaxID=133409 RepID=A0A8J4Q0F3_9MYCE|nr:hypothetical protein CYY_002247 [Polysphondylium violaceum]